MEPHHSEVEELVDSPVSETGVCRFDSYLPIRSDSQGGHGTRLISVSSEFDSQSLYHTVEAGVEQQYLGKIQTWVRLPPSVPTVSPSLWTCGIGGRSPYCDSLVGKTVVSYTTVLGSKPSCSAISLCSNGRMPVSKTVQSGFKSSEGCRKRGLRCSTSCVWLVGPTDCKRRVRGTRSRSIAFHGAMAEWSLQQFAKL